MHESEGKAHTETDPPTYPWPPPVSPFERLTVASSLTPEEPVHRHFINAEVMSVASVEPSQGIKAFGEACDEANECASGICGTECSCPLDSLVECSCACLCKFPDKCCGGCVVGTSPEVVTCPTEGAVRFKTFIGSSPYLVSPELPAQGGNDLVYGLTMFSLGDVAMAVATLKRDASGALVSPSPSAWEMYADDLGFVAQRISVGYVQGVEQVAASVDGVIMALGPQAPLAYPTLGRWQVLLAEESYLTGGVACCFQTPTDAITLFAERALYISGTVAIARLTFVQMLSNEVRDAYVEKACGPALDALSLSPTDASCEMHGYSRPRQTSVVYVFLLLPRTLPQQVVDPLDIPAFYTALSSIDGPVVVGPPLDVFPAATIINGLSWAWGGPLVAAAALVLSCSVCACICALCQRRDGKARVAPLPISVSGAPPARANRTLALPLVQLSRPQIFLNSRPLDSISEK
jgi:hypothetical protein